MRVMPKRAETVDRWVLKNGKGEYAADESCERFSDDLRDAHVFAHRPSRELGLSIIEVTVSIVRGAP